MRKVPKISLNFCLAATIAILSGIAVGSEFQKNDFYAGIEVNDVSGSKDLLFSTPYPALLLSEIMVDSGSEIEPKESGSASFLNTADLSFDNNAYLKKSKRILTSLTIRDLIFPFHTHF